MMVSSLEIAVVWMVNVWMNLVCVEIFVTIVCGEIPSSWVVSPLLGVSVRLLSSVPPPASWLPSQSWPVSPPLS